MDKAALAYSALWATLTAYAVLSALDFGAGFYYWLAGARKPNERVRSLTLRYLSPVWETTNVFLVLFIVGMIGFFPSSVGVFGTALLLPLSAAVIVLTLRGAFFAFHHITPAATRILVPIFGLGGLLVPALLVSFLSAGESGAIQISPSGQVTVSQAALWLSPLNLTLALVAVTATLYLSAIFLARFATRRNDTEVAAFYRTAAVRAGVSMLLSALALAGALRWVAPAHFQALLAIWPVHLVAATLFATALWAVARGGRQRSRLALIAALLQYMLALMTYGLTRLPYLLYPVLRVDDALTSPAMFTALIVTVIAGAVLIAPALLLLYMLFVRPATLRAPAHPTPAGPKPHRTPAAVRARSRTAA